MYLAATRPLITPAMTMVGMAIPAGDPLMERTCGAKGWASDWLTSVALDDDSHDDVYACVASLEKEEGFRILF